MRRALMAYALGLALFAGFVAIPFLTKKRDIPAEVPSPPPLTAVDLVDVGAGARVCMKDVGVSAESRRMRVVVGTYGRPGPRLRVSIGGRLAAVPAGFKDNSTLAVPIPPPGRGAIATVCIRNLGASKIALYAAADRSRSRVRTFVNGREVAATPTLSFAEAEPVSIAGRAGVIAGRIAVFRGFLDHAWVVWLLAVAMLAAVPLLVAIAQWRSEEVAQRRSGSSAE